MRVSNATWVWSDTHFGHRNIVKFQQRPESHEIIMLSEWAKRVPADADVLHLGDVWLRASNWRWASIIKQMPGSKFLILGNHDDAGDWYERAGFTIIDPFIWESRGVAFSHRPITKAFPGYPESDILGARSASLVEGWHTNVHGHIHGNTINRNHHFNEGDPLPGRRYINVSVEATGLAPVQLGNLL